MSLERDRRIDERAETIRKQEGIAPGRMGEDVAPEAPGSDAAEAVEANEAMKRQVGGEGGGADAALGVELAAEGYRMNSPDRAKHVAPGGEEESIEETGGPGPRGRYADR